MKTRLLSPYMKSKAAIYTFALLLIAAGNIIQSYYPHILGEFIDQLQASSMTSKDVRNYSLMLVLIALCYGSMAGLGQYLIMWLGRGFEQLMRTRLFRHFTRLGESFYAKHGVGQLLSYVMNDVTSVRDSISVCLNQTANAVILLISAFIMMAVSGIPWTLMIPCISPLVFIPFIVVYFGPRVRTRSRKVQNALARMTEIAEEQFGGIRVTKKFAVESVMAGRFGETVDRILEAQLGLVRMSSLFQALLPFIGALSLVIAIIYGGYLALNASISIGTFVSLTLYIRLMITPLQQIGNVINTMQRSRASLERLQELLAVVPEIQSLEQAAPFSGSGIKISSLSFRYPGSSLDALSEISLHISPGTTTAVIGRTGSGKTTLAKLLLRVYEAPPLTIEIGGEDIRAISLGGLRENIAYVPQDGFLFSTTMRDNIAFSHRDAEQSEVEAAARQAEIYGSIMEFREGFQTQVGERGVTLSGGQRQRMSLARGLIKQAPILILDDSVSAVDAVTETRIIRNIRELRRGKTTLIIAHRISALKHADQIIVLDEGKIVQQGTHEALLAEDGIYAQLYALQQGGTAHGSIG